MANLSNIITPTNVLTATNTATLTNKTISGASNTITNVPLSTGVTGTLPIANGGTNATATPTAGAVPYGTGTAYAFTAAGTSGQVLQSNGASAPTWATISTGGMTLLATVSPSGVNTIDATGLTSSKAIYIVPLVTLASADTLNMLFSVNNGSSFPGAAYTITTNATTPSGMAQIFNTNINAIKLTLRIISTVSPTRETDSTINAGTINAIRFYTGGGANFSSGSIYIYGFN